MLADEKSFWDGRIASINSLIQESLKMVDVKELLEAVKGFPAKSGSGKDARLEKTVLDALDHEARVLKATDSALKDFQKFAGTALAFFRDGFYADPSRLKRSTQVPPQVVLHTLLRELSTDLEIFQRSLQQRRLVNGQVSNHLFMLSVGDRVAAAALKPAFDAKLLEQGTVITHLGDDFDIRLVPYSPALLIEMPFTSGSVFAGNAIRPLPGHEHLALLHEVGHYVYHHGKIPNTGLTVEATLTGELFKQGITGGLANWLEELFADCYGLLVGGPVMAYSYQERLSQESPEALMVDTGDHPISNLRPLIQSETLRMIRAGSKVMYQIAPGLLDNNWHEFVDGKDLRNEVFQLQGVSRPISGGTIIMGLAPIIQKILDVLAPLQAGTKFEPWSKDLVPGQNLRKLSEQFEGGDFLSPVSGIENGNKDGRPDPTEIYHRTTGRVLPEAEWRPLFEFEGWSTEFSISIIPGKIGDMPSKVGDMPSN